MQVTSHAVVLVGLAVNVECTYVASCSVLAIFSESASGSILY